MNWSDLPFKPSQKTLRQFSGLWLVFFGGFALHQWLARGHATAASILAAIAVVGGLLGLIRPVAIRPIFVGWMVVVFPIGWAVSNLLLLLLYYGIFTPVSLFFKLTGRDVLNRRLVSGKESYWAAKSLPSDVRRYFKQY